MSTSGNDNSGFSKDSNYGYSGTSSGQGNWNTGGNATGYGSMGNGIVGLNGNPRYTVAPDGSNPNPRFGDMIRQILGPRVMPTAGPGVAPQPLAPPPPVIPIPRPNPFAKFTGPPIVAPVDPGIYPPSTPPPAPADGWGQVMYGPPGGGKFQDRIPQGVMNGGFAGGGRGGGGGGGW